VTLAVGWLPDTAYLYMLIFARVGTMFMLLPALGEQVIPARIRLSVALVLALVLHPLVADTFPPLPADILGVVGELFHELVIGLVLGATTRFVLMATSVAGSVIAYQSGLSVATAADPTQNGVQGALIGSFLSMLGVTLIFATDLHHVALAAIYDSYTVFSPTAPLMFGDALKMAVTAISGAFVIGVQMSAPFVVFGLVFYVGLGILARLMPQLQVFFIAMPANVAVGLILMLLLIGMMMGWYLSHYEAQLAVLRGG
jgi:flagellar biosynthetic protein FliR